MKKRSRAVSEPTQGRRQKAPEPKRGNAPKAAARSKPPPIAAETEVPRLGRDRDEAVEQLSAASDVLKVITSSPGDLKRVFEAILENATRLCEAKFGALWLREGDVFRIGAAHLPSSADVAIYQPDMTFALHENPNVPIARMVGTKVVLHVADLRTDQSYIERSPRIVPLVDIVGARTFLGVPMLKNNELVGAFVIYRTEVRPFSEKQIALMQNFAAQAVIAIENARLLNELRQRTTDLTERTADLTEALERQTATSEVLQVISRSAGDLEPVFAFMLENAVRICDAKFGIMNFPEPGGVRPVAMHNVPEAFAELRQRVVHFGPKHPLTRAAATKQVVQIPDLELYADEDPVIAKFRELTGARTILHVPMLKDEELVGIVSIYRQEVRPFTDKQVDVVKNFAAQAVIAVENARLLNELRQSLEQQTATSEVLQVISSSPGDLQPVFATMLEKAVAICNAKFGNIHRWDGEALHLVASHNTPPAFAEARRRSPNRPSPKSSVGRMIETKAMVHVEDAAEQPGYVIERDQASVAAVELGGVRTVLYVPMLRENELVGAFTLSRQEVRAFSEEQIGLVKNFAAQAVVAIENTRLLNELRQRTTDLTERTADLTEALEYQTATSEVLQVISGSPGDLQPVFAVMLEKAVRVCDATFGDVYRPHGDAIQLVAMQNTPPAFAEALKQTPHFRPSSSVGVRMVTTKSAVQVTDLAADPDYVERRSPFIVAAVELGGVRTVLAVPMSKENELIGAFILCRQEVRPFTDKQIELVKNFAAQAVIAIENTRLLKELRERTEEVEKLNQHLEQRVADQVGEIERMSRLRRFLPPQVADLIVASGSEKQLESHRREITALFCDLRGFTGFTESADAEDVMALLRHYHAAIGEIIIKYNGTLERYAGDGVMVVFNDPVPVENSALQAVLMALEVRDAIGALTETWRRLGHDIGFGIGIAHGFATLGTIGFEGRFDYAAIGTVSNVASRLCDEAKPGQILISPRVLMKVENAVTVEPVGEFELKGTGGHWRRTMWSLP